MWVKALSSAFDDAFARCALDFDGNLVLCGSHEDTATGHAHAILQKWTPEGQALWTRTVDTVNEAIFTDLTVWGTGIYLAGRVELTPGNDDALALKVSGSGNLVWARRWSSDIVQGDSFAACASFSTAAIDSFEFLAAGQYSSASLDPIPIVIGWDEDGVTVRSLRLGSGGSFS